MLRTTVPETAIYEYCQAGPCEGDIWPTWKRLWRYPVPQSSGVEGPPQGHFGLATRRGHSAHLFGDLRAEGYWAGRRSPLDSLIHGAQL